MLWVIDSEFIHEPCLTTLEVDGKTLHFYPFTKFYFGIYNPVFGYTFYENFDVSDTINYIFTKDPENSIQVYAFFNTAELSVHNCNFYDKLMKYGIQINKVIKKGKSYMVFLEKEGRKMQILDIMHITGAQNLDEFCKLYINKSPKDYLKNLGVQHDQDLVNNLTYEQLCVYNERDCVMTYESYMKFMQYMRNFILKNFFIKIDFASCFTLGSFASKILRHLEQIYKGNILSVFAKYKRKLNENINTYSSEFEELISVGLNSYMGGGLILNFLPPRTKLTNAYMYDVVSLYPISALLMAQNAPNLIKDIQRSNESLNKFLDDYTYEGLVFAKLKLKNPNILPYAGMKGNTNAHQINLFYPKQIERWFTFTELRILSKDYEIIYENPDLLTSFSNKYIYYWQNTHNYAIYTYFDTLLKQKMQIDKQKDPINYNLNKLLLNIAYGKLVEKEKDYFPKLFSPILASYLTSISRSIMYLIHQNTAYKTKHFATDSLIIQEKLNTDSILMKLKRNLRNLSENSELLYKSFIN